jgi:double-stranded uracil-DNA glycosylase
MRTGPRTGFRWTPDTIVYAITLWYRKNSRPPFTHEWDQAGENHPSRQTVSRVFGSWNAAIHAAGFTPRPLRPAEDHELLAYGVGVTNIAERPTRDAGQLSRDELRAGAAELERTVAHCVPRLVAVLGLTAYRTAFERPRAGWGLQPDTIGGRPVWILPNPSGLNAHYKPADFARLYAEARAYAKSWSCASASASGEPGAAV